MVDLAVGVGDLVPPRGDEVSGFADDQGARIPSVAHENAVDVILARYPGAKRSGFMEALRGLIDDMHGLDGDGSPDETWLDDRIVPDAFLIDGDVVIAFEVEVTNPVAKKMATYASLWFHLDCEGVLLRLVHVDRFVSEVELLPQAAWCDHVESHRSAP